MSEGSLGTQVAIPSTTEGVATPAAPSASSFLDPIYARTIKTERLGYDSETHRIGPGAPFPKPVCATFARGDAGAVQTWLVASGDPEWARTHEGIYRWLDEDPAFAPGGDGVPTRELVCHNGHGFDCPVQALHFPHLISAIFRALWRGQVRDTITREKLLNLACSGVVDYYFSPDGIARKVHYNLANLVLKWLGIDRTAGKGVDVEGKLVREDVWRLNFNTLDGLPRDQFPRDAVDYAIQDASDALDVCRAQDRYASQYFGSRGARGHDGGPFDVFLTEPLHVGAMFCLSLATFEGFGVDRAVVEDMESKIELALRPEQTYLLFESGLMSRPEPSRPYKTKTLHKPVESGADPCACGAPSHEVGTPKWVNAEPAHLSRKKLLELVVKAWAANRLCDEDDCPKRGGECERHGLPSLKRTEASKTFPEGQISCDGEVIADLAPFDPVLAQYDHWGILDKLRTLEVPRLREALAHGGVIHGGFSEMKKTERIGSNRNKLFPSTNITQIPRAVEVDELGADSKPILDAKGKKKIIRIEPRNAYLPRRQGWVLVSIDYSFIELCTHAQRMKDSIGYSVLLDKINKNFDPHAYLASQLASSLDVDFAECCKVHGVQQPDDVYRLFVRLKGGSDDEKKFYKDWRNFSKPVGLGYPGGLGARTLVVVAKKVYGVTIKSVELAKSFKEVWLTAFPENREYLNRYVRDNLRDEVHSDAERERFAFFSPLGCYRAKTTFTEAANGFSLQGPSAEGMKLSLFRLQRACWDPDMRSCLYGCRVVAAIHDEAIISMPEDVHLPERAAEASRLWIEGMRIITPDVNIKAEPAAMRRWIKAAEPVYSKSDGRLRVWEPGVKYETDADGRLWTA